MTRSRARPRAWEVASFAVAFTVASWVGLALIWSADIVHTVVIGKGPETVVFTAPTTGDRVMLRPDEWGPLNSGWVAYVTGRSGDQPAGAGTWFTESEREHMSDVRGVFIGAQLAAIAAAVVLLVLAWRARARGSLASLLSAGAISSAVGTTALAVVGALAFDAAFLTFHRIFFPQGNFLFPPGSNLLALYPFIYWYGITLGIAFSFILFAIAVALAGHLASRGEGPSSAIVTPQ